LLVFRSAHIGFFAQRTEWKRGLGAYGRTQRRP
jgi:hypothetical protein